MSRSTVANRWNLELIEEYQRRWRDDPASVDESWRSFFEGFELGQSFSAAAGVDPDASKAQAAVTRLVDGYREIGHYLADLDPLQMAPSRDSHELLGLDAFGLDAADLDKVFYNRLTTPPHAPLRELLEVLKETYCRKIGVEYMHIRNPNVRRWLQDRMEPGRNRPDFDLRKKRRILLKLNAAEQFETFLSTRYVGQKRFSLEGGEVLIPLLDAVIERSARFGVREIVFGMPHRGR
ncbi:MAG: 2-oxoglutarate dehydrogenase E1 component, partial [Isosphaeraceae bacterium]